MFCENCGNRIDDGDVFCCECGWKVSSDFSEGDQTDTISEPEQEVQDFEAVEQVQETETVQTPMDVTEQLSQEQMPVGQEVPPVQDIPAPKAKKKKGVLIVVGGVVVAVALVGVVAAANFNKVSNVFMKTFSSPAKYYQYIEKREVAENAEAFANIYQNVVLNNVDVTDTHYDTTVKVEISDDALKELEELSDEYLDIDNLSSIKNVSLSASSNMKDNIGSANYALSLGKTQIVSTDITMDFKKDNLYVQIPEVMEKALCIEDFSELSGIEYSGYDDYMELLEMFDKVYESAPDKAEVEKLAYDYMCTAINCIDKVEKESTTLEAEDVSQKCTELKATIDEKTLNAMFKAILSKMKDDKKLEKIITDMATLDENLDASEVYDDFIDELKDTLDDIEDAELGSGKLILSVYVDGKGDVIGRELKTKGSDEDLKIVYMMPKKGAKFGYELSIENRYAEAALKGSGKISGDKLTGEFDLKAAGNKLLSVNVSNFDQKKFKKGFLEGEFIFDIKSGLVGNGIAGAILTGYKYGFDVTTSESAAKVVSTVYDGDKAYVTVTVDGKRSKGKKADLPSGKKVVSVSADDMDDVDIDDLGISMKQLKENLKKAKVPSDIIDAVEDIEEELEDYAD